MQLVRTCIHSFARTQSHEYVRIHTHMRAHVDSHRLNKQDGAGEETKEEPKPLANEVAVDEAIKSEDKFVSYTATYKKTLDSMAELKVGSG